MPNHSMFGEIVIAAIGGAIVVIGLLMEHFGEKDWYKDTSHFSRSKKIRFYGEWFVIIGVGIEVLVAGYTAVGEWELRQITLKNDPLKQPISEISAIVNIQVSATNFDATRPFPLDHSWINLGGFSLGAKEARYFKHYDDIMSRHVTHYTISIKFESNPLPVFVNNDINGTNDNFEPAFPTVSVTNAIAGLKTIEMYLSAIPKTAGIVKGNGRIFINGFKTDFKCSSDSIGKDFYEFNPDKTGLYLVTTNVYVK